MKQYFAKLILPPVLVLALILALVPASAAVVQPSASYYVTDEAGVISSETEAYIVSMNGELEYACDGAQIVVVAVDFLDGMDIEDYCYRLFSDWQIGSASEDNGVLLLLAIGEENYWCMQGTGLINSLSSGTIDDILWNYLEPDFAVGNYDAGVRSVFDALCGELCSIYGVSNSGIVSDGYYDGSQYIDQMGQAVNIMSWIVTIIAILAIMIIILYIYTVIRKNQARRQVYTPPRPTYHPTHGPRPGQVRPTYRPVVRPRPIIFYGGSHPRPTQTHQPRPTSGGLFGGGSSHSSRPTHTFGGGSSFGGGGRSGIGRGGGGASRGGGAGRRGR